MDMIIQSLMALHEVETMLAIWAVHYSKKVILSFTKTLKGLDYPINYGSLLEASAI